jgi:hypothetical protein
VRVCVCVSMSELYYQSIQRRLLIDRGLLSMSSSVTFLRSVGQLLIFVDVYSMIRFCRCRAAAAECRGRPYPP